MKYSLGLDIGSESVGWAVVQLNKNDEPVKLISMGVRVFDAVVGEQEQSETPAKVRRMARSQRRRLRNKKKRKRKFIELCMKHGLIKEKEEALEFLAMMLTYTPWQLRVKGLDEVLSKDEWLKVLYHILNHRGFKAVVRSTEDESPKEDETKKMKGSAAALRKMWQQEGYRTVAEFFEKDEKWKKEKGGRRRNREGDYSFTIFRDDLICEVRLLFECQRKLGNPFASEEFESEYIAILDEKPNIQEGEKLIALVGMCTFEPEEKRAPKATLTGQLFKALKKLTNLKVVNLETGEQIRLDAKMIDKVIEKALVINNVKAKHILKIANIEEGYINGYKDEEIIISLSDYHKIRGKLEKKFPEVWNALVEDEDFFNKVAEVLTYYKTEEATLKKLIELGLSENAAKSLLSLQFRSHLSLSVRAMKKINEYLKQGYVYSKSCELAGYNHLAIATPHKVLKIPPFDGPEVSPEIRQSFLGITNPNVVRALTQARKVVNAIIQEFGEPPARFVIELAREFGQSKEQKNKIWKEQLKREKERKRIEEEITTLYPIAKINPKMIEKMILYKQQNGLSAYSLHKIDKLRMLTDETYTEVDHIVPRSLSFDNSMANKVLVLTDDNRNKGDQLASPFIKRDFGEGHFQKFKSEFVEVILDEAKKSFPHRVKEINRKQALLLKEEFTEEEKKEFQRRMLHATQYATRFFKKVLEACFPGSKVVPVSGKLVSNLRWLSGLSSLKNRGESDKHHAVDAALCAVSDYKIVKSMSDYLRLQETTWKRKNGARLSSKNNQIFPDEKFEPYQGFRKDIEEKFENLLVSRMPRRRVTGAGHKETILSLKHVIRAGIDVPKRGKVSLSSDSVRPTKRVRLDQLTYPQIQEILKKPSPILVDEKSNWKLYDLIRKRLREVENQVTDKNKWAEIAFGSYSGKIYMPRKDGGQGPEVRKIKIFDTYALSGIRVRGGMAQNAGLVRLDFYRKVSPKGKNQYYIVPVYTADIAMGIKPDRAATAHKPENEWVKIDDSFEFLFHIFPGDYLRIKRKGDEKPFIVCFKWFDRSVVRIKCDYPDRSNRRNSKLEEIGISIKNCSKVEKLHVDILGRGFVVKKEKPIYAK